MSRRATRREFLNRSALAAAGFWAAETCAAAEGRSPNDKLNIGIIGVHSRGAANMAGLVNLGGTHTFSGATANSPAITLAPTTRSSSPAARRTSTAQG